MTASTITSLEKYVLLRSSAVEYSARSESRVKTPSRLSEGRSGQTGSAGSMHQYDRYEDRIGRYADYESRMTRRNRVALSIRTTDFTLQQIATHIDHMESALDKLAKQYPPYPPGSKERIAELRKVNAFRKQIEQLTFPRPTEENEFIPSVPDGAQSSENETPDWPATENAVHIDAIRAIADEQRALNQRIPELADDAQDGEIKASIVRLRETSAQVRRQRGELSAKALLLFRGMESLNDLQVAESKSIFIGRHLGNHPGIDLTTSPSLLKEYLN